MFDSLGAISSERFLIKMEHDIHLTFDFFCVNRGDVKSHFNLSHTNIGFRICIHGFHGTLLDACKQLKIYIERSDKLFFFGPFSKINSLERALKALEKISRYPSLPLIVDRAPLIVTLPFAKITPRKQHGGKKFSGEVYDHQEILCDISLRPFLDHGYQHCPDRLPLENQQPQTYLSGRFFYLGSILEMFGHDLFEPVSRMWPLLTGDWKKNIDGVIFHRWKMDSSDAQVMLSEPIATILSLLGISSHQVYLVGNEVIQVEELVVPEQLFKIGNHCLEKFNETIDYLNNAIPSTDCATPHSIYLSRSRLPDGSKRFPHERLIEAIMADMGYTIIHPQGLSLGNQIRLVRQAKRVAGLDGSAMHLAIFCRPATRVICLDTRYVRTQFILESLRRLDVLHVDISSYKDVKGDLNLLLHLAHTWSDRPMEESEFHGWGAKSLSVA